MADNTKLSSPFNGYTKKAGTPSGGKQKKAAGTGFYLKDNTKYYIKRSEKFPADDVAEIMTAELGRNILPQENKFMFAECTPIQHQKGTMFVRSTCANGWKALYEHSYGSNFFLDRIRPLKYKKTFKLINDLNDSQKEQLANILASCLWLNEYDCGTQNIGQDEDGNIVKIDHGWGLANICKQHHANVRLFEKKSFFGSRGTHKFAMIPTNHLNDFKYLLNTNFFTDALRNTIKNIKLQENSLRQVINEKMADIIKNCSDPITKTNTLKAFADHVGLQLTPELLNMTPGTSLALQRFICDKLTDRLIQRRASLENLLATQEKKIINAPPLACTVGTNNSSTSDPGEKQPYTDKTWNTLLENIRHKKATNSFNIAPENNHKIIFPAAKFTAEKFETGDIFLTSTEPNASSINIQQITDFLAQAIVVAVENGVKPVTLELHSGSVSEIYQVFDSFKQDKNVTITIDELLITTFRNIATSSNNKESDNAKGLLARYQNYCNLHELSNRTISQPVQPVQQTTFTTPKVPSAHLLYNNSPILNGYKKKRSTQKNSSTSILTSQPDNQTPKSTLKH